ncbi:MAG: hypothetical protein IT265_15890 [Saprospiraceae bacterium]|nr:hypothetical protein [Saprospiraceae bacterium]
MKIEASYSLKPLSPNFEEVLNLKDPNQYKSELLEFLHPVIIWGYALGFIWFIKSVLWAIFTDQSHLAAYGWLYCGGIAITSGIFTTILESSDKDENQKRDKLYQELQAKNNAIIEARQTTLILNNLLLKSKELVNNVIPFYLNSIHEKLITCEMHLHNRAINNYFDSMELTIRDIAFFKDIIDDLKKNSNVYSTTLVNRNHTFPTTFPIFISDAEIMPLLNKFSEINYEADKASEFAIVFNQRKLIAVNIAGFSNVKQAIDNAADRIENSIDELKYSVNSGFSTLNSIQKEFSNAYMLNSSKQLEYQNEIETNLSKINSKLYYIQYNRKPNTSFNRFDA